MVLQKSNGWKKKVMRDFELMAEINPTRLSLSDWLKVQNDNSNEWV